MSCGVMAWLWPSVKPFIRMFGAPRPSVMPGSEFGFLTWGNWFQWNMLCPPLTSFTLELLSTCVHVASACSLRLFVPMADAIVRADPPVYRESYGMRLSYRDNRTDRRFRGEN